MPILTLTDTQRATLVAAFFRTTGASGGSIDVIADILLATEAERAKAYKEWLAFDAQRAAETLALVDAVGRVPSAAEPKP